MKIKFSYQALVFVFVFAITFGSWIQLFLPVYLDFFDTDLNRYKRIIEAIINKRFVVVNPLELLFYSGIELLVSSHAWFVLSDDLARLIIVQVVAFSVTLFLLVIKISVGSSFKSRQSVYILFFTLMNPLVIEFYLLNVRSSIAFSMMIGALLAEGWRKQRILIGIAAVVMHLGVAMIPLVVAVGYILRRVLIGSKFFGVRYLHALGCVAFAISTCGLLNTAFVMFGVEFSKTSISLLYMSFLASFFFYGLFLARRLLNDPLGFTVLFLCCLFIFGWLYGLNFNRFLQMNMILMSLIFMRAQPNSVKKLYLGALVGFDFVLFAVRYLNMG